MKLCFVQVEFYIHSVLATKVTISYETAVVNKQLVSIVDADGWVLYHQGINGQKCWLILDNTTRVPFY